MATRRHRRCSLSSPLASAAALWVSSSRLDARVDPADTRLLTQPAVSASQLAFIYAGDLFVADLGAADVGNVRRLTTDDGVESNPAFSPDGKTIAFSAQYDGNVDVYTVPVDRRRTDAADVASGRRHGPGLHARRQERAVHVAARDVHDPLRAALHRAGAGRHRGSAADPQRVPRHLLAGRPAHRLQPARRALPAVEAVSRRHGLAAVAVQREGARDREDPAAGGAAPTTPIRCGWATPSTSVGPRRRVQPVRLRYEEQAGPAAHAPRRLPGADRLVGRRPHRLRAGRIAAPVRSARRNREEADDRRALGPAGDPAAVREGREMDPRRGAVADRRPGGVQLPRRDRHGSRPRRATSGISPTARRCTTAFRRGRRTADRWRGSPTRTTPTGSTSAARTARASRAPSRSKARASTATRCGRRTRRRSPTTTTRSRSTGST